jgi:methionine-rich copper-binding protein CopC
MKNATILLLLLVPSFLFSQIKQIAESELTVGSGIFFAAEKNASTITITIKGPTDRYFAVGFGTGMSSGDLVMYSNNGVTTDFRDHNMIGYTTPATDAQQDWTLISNNIVGSQRVIVASRALNSGDLNDLIFNFSDNTQTLFWAKSSSASFGIAYHGAGNRGSGILRNWVLDVTGPVITSTNPVDNSTVAAPSSISATYNENLVAGTGTITLFNDSDQTQATFTVPSANVVISGTTATINTGLLLADKAYHVGITAGTFQDASGNNSAAVSLATVWNFNTSGTAAPTITSVDPLDNSVGVSLTTNLTLNFGEAVQRGAGTISLFSGSGTLVQSFVANTSPNVTQPTPSQIVINPTANLIANTNYYVNYTGTAISDLTGDGLPALTNQTTWNFNTSDGINPLAVTFSPSDNSVAVPLTSDYSIVFDEPIFAGTGVIELLDASNNLYDQFDVTNSSQVTFSGNTMTLNQNFALQANEDYHIIIPAGAITDGINSYSGLALATDWNFNTNDIVAPVIISTTPLDNATNVSQTPNFNITFSEDIQEAGAVTLIELIGPSGTINFTVGVDATISGASLTFSPATPLAVGNYHVLIASGEITDLVGNNFSGITSDTVYNFTVVDTQAPSIVSVNPADGSTLLNVTNEVFTITFNEPVQWSTGSIRIVRSSDSSFVQEYSSTVNTSDVTFTGNEVEFIYSFPSNVQETYSIVIGNNALEDLNGNSFAGILNLNTWNFEIMWVGIEENTFGQITYQNGAIVFEQELNFKLISIDGKTLSEGKSDKVNLENLVKGSYILQLENQFSTIVYVH